VWFAAVEPSCAPTTVTVVVETSFTMKISSPIASRAPRWMPAVAFVTVSDVAPAM
jgi:hypothetical protein